MTAPPRAAVIVPAHDEAAVIDRCLTSLLAEAGEGEFEVVVVCNACRDDTAERAARHPGVRVRSIPQASKQAALQAGDEAVGAFPRIYLDADVQLTTAGARALVDRLAQPGIEAVAPRLRFALGERTWAVREYFRFVEQLPVFGEGYIGAGAFALDADGRARFDRWPLDLPDDAFVQRLVPAANRASVALPFAIEPPRSLRLQLRRAVRVQRLNRALERQTEVPLSPPTTSSTLAHLQQALRRPTSWPGLALFLGVAVTTRVRSWVLDRRQLPTEWARDLSSR
ncbi:glycosyltransferase [Egicoccus halophilus]|uniref:4,4'-diaponeurosporenoate glycosyltransferase n=1 Tax=Egicoccus halophilus TaxID=1670830 RepID=A0A8J3EUA6_9ACTN|nr:glycosyltransferase [Egicoccus halophilus]GGI05492.1 hypothetical protein GCM10011354_14370 [Egicoccus halophilus]